MDTFSDIWKEVLEICNKSNQISEVVISMWLSPLKEVKFENDTAIFLTNSDFRKSIVMDKYAKILKDAFYQIMGFPVEIDIIVDPNMNEENAKKSTSHTQDETEKNNGDFEYHFPQFTFENFIVANTNSLAYEVAMSVAKAPGSKYNPFLIYGHSGLGKTHLLYAIYNKVKERDPDAVVIYTTGENFMIELIEMIGNKDTISFHNKYRNVDVLLVDDIQIIQKGASVQEEFFHTFDALQRAGKQIVMTSDVPPKYMEVLDERLRTRFEMGIMADIKPPDVDTRKAIIKKKCTQLGITLNENIIDLIANKIKNNVRQLEGTIKKIEAMTKVFGSIPSLDQVQQIINDITTDNQPVSVLIDKIIENVAKAFGISADDIKSDKRQANITQARQAAMYIIKEITDLTLKDIGTYFGKNHATVLHSIDMCEKKMQENSQYKGIIINITRDCQEK